MTANRTARSSFLHEIARFLCFGELLAEKVESAVAGFSRTCRLLTPPPRPCHLAVILGGGSERTPCLYRFVGMNALRSMCCRLVRGFAFADALEVLIEWNARCQPRWSERELTATNVAAQRGTDVSRSPAHWRRSHDQPTRSDWCDSR